MAFDYTNNLDIDKTTGKAIGGSKAYSQTTPKLGLTYDFGKNKGIYANYSKGFAPSGLTAIFRKDLKLPKMEICFITIWFRLLLKTLKSGLDIFTK